MKKLLLAGVALAALSGTAFAADLPRRAAPPVFTPVPVFTWTGFYIGGHVGYANAGTRFIDVDGYNPLAAGTFSGERDAFFGGGQVGFNYQIGSLVVGVESDLGYMDIGGGLVQPGSPAGDTVGTLQSGFYATITGRVGFAADRFLIYAKGGGAYLDSQVAVIDACNVGGCGLGLLNAVSNADRWGYTVGAGIEYAFTNNWTAKVEYAYFDFGRETAVGLVNGVAPTVRFRNDLDAHTVKLGVNYKF